jgi:Tol biopolymer transport system component
MAQALAVGSRIGAYEIVGPLGAGGMGEVYRARDTRLGRDVAIKALPSQFAAEPERLARFEREARVLASMSHPNIAGIYGLEEVGGARYLVLECIEGESLGERLKRGPIAIDEALGIAKQICDALEGAHENAVIHRDLKPANIMLTRDGQVKLLDFGLSRVTEPAAESDPTNSPTITALGTQLGVILGTASYMAPEQAAGKQVDRRADIWAFGVVLWEMLTGRRLFDGETVSHTLADVLRAPIHLAQLPAGTPRTIRELVTRCLDRDASTRLRDIGEARIVIQRYLANPAGDPAATSSVPARPRALTTWLGWGLAALLALALGGYVVVQSRRAAASSRRAAHLFVPLPDEGMAPYLFALSPDGRSVAMVTTQNIVVRSLESGAVRTLTATEAARAPFWSADSRRIAFFADNKLKIVPASGGIPQVLCDNVTSNGSGTWNREGVILFSAGGSLMRANASGGSCAEWSKANADRANVGPVFLPDGIHFLYGHITQAEPGIYVASLQNPSGRRLLPEPSTPLFAPDEFGSSRGRLLFVRDQTLMAQPFDPVSLALSGEPVEVAAHVTTTGNNQIAASVADDGTVMYLTNSRADRQMVWFDRTGTEAGRAANTGLTQSAVSLSPDGKKVAFRRSDALGRPMLWLDDLDRNQEVQLTDAPVSAMAWSRDGQRLAFVGGGAQGDRGIYVKNVNAGAERLLVRQTEYAWGVSDWSRDGRWIAYTEADPRTGGGDIWILPMAGDTAAAKAIPLVQTSALETQAQFSPDGKWVAYTEGGSSGQRQVVLRSFNGDASPSDTRWQVSSLPGYGREPRWRADSKELFYLDFPATGTGSVRLMAVSIGSGPSPVGVPKVLFEPKVALATVPSANIFLYAPSPDGQRFLIDTFASAVRPALEVVLNLSAPAK